MENSDQVRICNLEWIKELGVPLEIKGAQVTIKVMNRTIDFWPSSDTYYLHSKNLYGTGIMKITRLIKSRYESASTDVGSKNSGGESGREMLEKRSGNNTVETKSLSVSRTGLEE